MKRLAQRTTCLLMLLTCGTCNAGIVFNFDNNSAFDGAGVGAQMTVGGLTIEHVGFEYRDLSNAPTIGSLVSTAGSTNIDNPSGLGVNNPTITNGNFDTAFGPGGENNNFNFDESWTFTFDKDVIFDSISFQSLDVGDEFDVSFGGSSFNLTNGASFADPFSGALISAGTNITFAFTGAANDDQARIALFDVTAVPEPSGLCLMLLGMTSGCFVRRRRD